MPGEQVARPRGNRRVSEDGYRLTGYLGAPRLKAWIIITIVVTHIGIIIILVGHVAGGSIELPINLEGSATRAGLLAVNVVLFGQVHGRACPLLRSRLEDPISLSSKSVFKGRGGASVSTLILDGAPSCNAGLVLDMATVMLSSATV